jgi:hypothetical protein
MVQPFFGACGAINSGFGGYELGFGAFTWVYEKARFEEDGLEGVLGTFFGADDMDERFQELVKVD